MSARVFRITMICSILAWASVGPGCGRDASGPSATPEGGGADAATRAAGTGDAGDRGAIDSTLCEPFVPCGGDPEGTWVIEGWCLESPATVPDCPSAKPDIEIALSGTATFGGDRSFSGHFEHHMSLSYSLPPECVPSGTTRCEELGTDAVPCSGDPTEGCSCESPKIEEVEDEEGTWSIEGSTLTTELTVPEKETTRNPLCVEGDTIRILVPGGPIEPVMILRRQP